MNARRPSPSGQYYPDLEQHSVVSGTYSTEPELRSFWASAAICSPATTRWSTVSGCIGVPHVVGYSFKTNYQVARSGIFRQRGAWAEVVSGREYRLARELGYAGSSIIFNGP